MEVAASERRYGEEERPSLQMRAGQERLAALERRGRETQRLARSQSSRNHRGMTKQKAHRDMSPTLSLDPRVPRRSSLFVIPFGPRSSQRQRPPSSLSSTPSSHRTRPRPTFNSHSSPGNRPLHPSPRSASSPPYTLLINPEPSRQSK
ncbi:uncharacterized protein LOC121880518 isoform X2 [Thunnus maccoyii]|uniref:uncharacterized protein LOC121880518 isoform X2 n=1 Tax=Thunnus maccoyii TaxID=8240 RepID=UPI001C4AF69A|nr:uncharacterized protein LOC121880518 isoform X2 [Thunnus maccoyii]